MRRFILLVSMIVMVITLGACSGQAGSENSIVTPPAVAKSEDKNNDTNASTPTPDPQKQADNALKEELLVKADTRRDAIRASKSTIEKAEEFKLGETYSGKAYFLSPNGNDDNDGLRPETAWATLEKVNEVSMDPGDAVFFQRGGIWYGQLKAQPGVTYSAYGEGVKPGLYGNSKEASDPGDWSLLENTDNIWVYKDKVSDCGGIFFNGGESNGLKVTSTINKDPDIKTRLTKDLAFYSVVDKEYYESNRGGGIPTGDIGFIPTATALYLRCDKGNPGEVFDSVIISPCGNIIYPADNTVFDNLCVKYCGSHAIFGWGIRLMVQNCEFGWIGGSIQYFDEYGIAMRFGNAVENDGTYDLYTVRDNYVYQVYDAALTNQNDGVMENITYSGNLIEYCNYGIEIFNWNDDGTNIYRNLLVEDNYILYSGDGWCKQRPEYGWNAAIEGHDSATPSENYIIRNNVFFEAGQCLLTIGSEDKYAPKLQNNIYVQTKGDNLLRWQSIEYKNHKPSSKEFLLQLDPGATIID